MNLCNGLFNFFFARRRPSFITRAHVMTKRSQKNRRTLIIKVVPNEIVHDYCRIENVRFFPSPLPPPKGVVYFNSITRKHKSKRLAEKVKQLNIHLPTNAETAATSARTTRNYYGNRDVTIAITKTIRRMCLNRITDGRTGQSREGVTARAFRSYESTITVIGCRPDNKIIGVCEHRKPQDGSPIEILLPSLRSPAEMA